MSWLVRAEVVQVLVAPVTWKAKRLAVLVAVSVLRRVKRMAGEPEAMCRAVAVVLAAAVGVAGRN